MSNAPAPAQQAPSLPPNAAATSQRDGKTAIVLYKHYDLLYWWVVWLYAGVAWIVTGTQGKGFLFTDKELKFHTEPLVGIGFLAVLLFVAIFTAIRARGVLSAVLVFSIIAIGAAIHYAYGWGDIMKKFPDLRVHMNQAFYGVVFAVLFPVWLLTTFVFNHLHYYTVDHGRQISDIRRIGGRRQNFVSHTVGVKKLDDDIFVHRILGLWWLGFGTGDIELTFNDAGGGMQKVILENVWRADHKIKAIQKII